MRTRAHMHGAFSAIAEILVVKFFSSTSTMHITHQCVINISTPPPIGERSIVMSVSVCLSVRHHIFGTTRPIFTSISMLVTYARSSVLLWRRSDTLCTSGIMDDAIFAYKPRLLDTPTS